MANDPALKIDALATALSSLVDAVGTDAPEFEQVQSPAVRRDVVARYNSQLVEAYTRVYAAVLNPSAGYGADVIHALVFAVRALESHALLATPRHLGWRLSLVAATVACLDDCAAAARAARNSEAG